MIAANRGNTEHPHLATKQRPRCHRPRPFLIAWIHRSPIGDAGRVLATAHVTARGAKRSPRRDDRCRRHRAAHDRGRGAAAFVEEQSSARGHLSLPIAPETCVGRPPSGRFLSCCGRPKPRDPFGDIPIVQLGRVSDAAALSDSPTGIRSAPRSSDDVFRASAATQRASASATNRSRDSSSVAQRARSLSPKSMRAVGLTRSQPMVNYAPQAAARHGDAGRAPRRSHRPARAGERRSARWS